MVYYAYLMCSYDAPNLLNLESIDLVQYIIINGSIHGETINIACYIFPQLASFIPMALSRYFLVFLTSFMYFRSDDWTSHNIKRVELKPQHLKNGMKPLKACALTSTFRNTWLFRTSSSFQSNLDLKWTCMNLT